MTKLKLKELKWQNVELKGSVLHFSLYFSFLLFICYTLSLSLKTWKMFSTPFSFGYFLTLLITFSLKKVNTTFLINLLHSQLDGMWWLRPYVQPFLLEIKLYHRCIFLKGVLNHVPKHNMGMLPREWWWLASHFFY